jgi:hypothetical protein
MRHGRISVGSVPDIGLFLTLFLGADPAGVRICRILFRTMNRQCICLTCVGHILDLKHTLNFGSQTCGHIWKILNSIILSASGAHHVHTSLVIQDGNISVQEWEVEVVVILITLGKLWMCMGDSALASALYD